MRLALATSLLSVLMFSACRGSSTEVNSNASSNINANSGADFKPPQPIKPIETVDPSFKACNPYFPLVPGSIVKYVLNYSSGLVADLTVVVDVADEGGRKVFTQRSQIVDRSGGMQIVQSTIRRFVCDGDRVQILSEKTESNIAGQVSSSDFNFKENALMMTDPKSMSIKGSTWSQVFKIVLHSPDRPTAPSDMPTIVSFEVMGPQDVTTAVGTFKTVGVLRKVGTSQIMDYFAPGLGLVKRQSKDGNSWEIREYSGLKPQDI